MGKCYGEKSAGLMDQLKHALSQEWQTTQELREYGTLSTFSFSLFSNYLMTLVSTGTAEREKGKRARPQRYRLTSANMPQGGQPAIAGVTDDLLLLAERNTEADAVKKFVTWCKNPGVDLLYAAYLDGADPFLSEVDQKNWLALHDSKVIANYLASLGPQTGE